MIMFNSKECEWSDLELFFNGVKITKVQSVKYKKAQEKELLYAAGDDPISIQRGNKSYVGSIRLLKGALDHINQSVVAAGGEDILDASYTVVVNYKKKGNRTIQTDTLIGLEVQEYERGMEQNAKFMAIELPIIFLKLKSL